MKANETTIRKAERLEREYDKLFGSIVHSDAVDRRVPQARSFDIFTMYKPAEFTYSVGTAR